MTAQTTKKPQEKADLRAPLLGTAVTGALVTIVAFAAVDRGAGLSTALGATVAVANLWALGKIVVALTTPEDEVVEAGPPTEEAKPKSGRGLAWGGLALIKFVAIGALLWLTLKNGLAHPLFLALGFTALPIGITAASVLSRAKV